MAHGISNSLRMILLSGLILLQGGCNLWANRVALNSVTIDTVPGANDNSPVAVDIVAVSDPALLPTLQALSASQWFSAKSQLLRDSPDGLRIWSLELVPGSRFATEENPLRGVRAEATLLFARYRSAGDHRMRLDNRDDLHLRLTADEAILAH